MSNPHTKLPWEPETLEKFEKMIARIPLFHRSITLEVAPKKAEMNAKERASGVIEEQDIVRAFFSEVPMAFYSMMIKLMDDVGFRYKEFEPQEKKKDKNH